MSLSYSLPSLNPLNDPGVSTTVNVDAETTSAALFNQFQSDVNTIGTIVSGSATASSLSNDQIATLTSTIGQIINSLQNGDGNGNYYTLSMAQNLDLLFRSLTASGIDPASITPAGTPAADVTASQSAAWNQWRDLLLSSDMVQPLFSYAATATNQSLQSMIELMYVKSANDTLSANLTSLQNAVNTTQSVLSNLGDLQNLHNLTVVNNKPPFSQFFDLASTFGGSSTAYMNAYQAAASAYYNASVIPTVVGAPSNLNYGTIASTAVNQGTELANIPANTYALANNSLQAQILAMYTHAQTGSELDPTNATNANQTVFAIDNGDVYTNSATPLGDGTHDFRVLSNSGTYISIGTGSDQKGINESDGGVAAWGSPGVYAIFIKQPSSYQVPQNLITTFNMQEHDVYDFGPGTANASAGSASQVTVSYKVYYVPFSTGSEFFDAQVGGIYMNNTATKVNLSQSFTGYTVPAGVNAGNLVATATLATAFNSGSNTTGEFDPLLWDSSTQLASSFQLLNNGVAATNAWLSYNGLKGASAWSVSTASVASLISAQDSLVRVREALSAQLPLLSAVTPLVNGAIDPNSLYATTKAVYNDINNIFNTTAKAGGRAISATDSLSVAMAGLYKWLMDGATTTNTASNTGAIQTDITTAITAGQNLNTQQQNNVQNFLYVFEEYEKSASAILQQLTQIIEDMAKKISQG